MAGWVWQGIGEWSLPDLCWRRKEYCHHRHCASPSRKCRNTRALCTADTWLGLRSRECEAEESGKISVHALKYDAKCYQHCNSCSRIFPAGSCNIATRLYSRLQTGDWTFFPFLIPVHDCNQLLKILPDWHRVHVKKCEDIQLNRILFPTTLSHQNFIKIPQDCICVIVVSPMLVQSFI